MKIVVREGTNHVGQERLTRQIHEKVRGDNTIDIYNVEMNRFWVMVKGRGQRWRWKRAEGRDVFFFVFLHGQKICCLATKENKKNTTALSRAHTTTWLNSLRFVSH